MTDDLQRLVDDLHDHLAATADLAIDHRANRWLGEAEAVTADVAAADLPAATVRERIEHVRDLLANVGETENAEADEHVAAAQELADRILDDSE
ncbi:hypothetical protein ACFQH6_13745 [Halobacteriaceae archaeon GCM10025711]